MVKGIVLGTVFRFSYSLARVGEVGGYLRQGRLVGRKAGRKWLISEPKLKAFAMGDDVELAREQIREEILNLKKILDVFLKKGDITQDYYDKAISRLDNLRT